MPSSIKDNRTRGSVGEFLRGKIKENAKLSFVSAYFTIYAYDKLREPLNGVDSLDFLFGEPSFVSSIDPEKTIAKSFGIEDGGMALSDRLQQKAAAADCAEWIRSKVNIKSVKNYDLLHGKMYHIDNAGVEEAIIGSSNFTAGGLGLNDRSNIELNLEVNDKRDTADLKSWFAEIWNNDEIVEDVKQTVLDYLEQLYTDTAPNFVYFKTLFHIFEQFLLEDVIKSKIDDRVKIIDTQIWEALYDFQRDGAKGAINKLMKFNGCILADSVGLGKTFTALAVIKYFELLNYRVLVLCPKRLQENWTVYRAENNSTLNRFEKDRFGFTVLAHTDLSRYTGTAGNINLETFQWGNFDLVVIDESHNFRNNTQGRTTLESGERRMSRYERLMEKIIKEGLRTKVLLLSATPVNNQLKDLRNQISLITTEDITAFQEALGIADYSETFRIAQQRFTQWAESEKRAVKNLLNVLDSAFFKILDALSIARSRTHIKRFYDLKAIGAFPVRTKPVSVYSEIDTERNFMSYDKLYKEINGYKLSIFNPSRYVLPEFADDYEYARGQKQISLFTQKDREYYLIGMMRINFMKRLESSVHSFAISIGRTIDKIKDLEKKIKAFQANTLLKTDYQLDLPVDPEDDDSADAQEVGKKTTFKLAHLDLDEWLKDLRTDIQQLHSIHLTALDVNPQRDEKLADLKKLILQKINSPTVNRDGAPVKKILLFTAFADTAAYLYKELMPFIYEEHKTHIAVVTGGTTPNRTTFGKNDFNAILINFSPVSKERANRQGEQIDVLIATDCISEGQNLQDCDLLINYDIHWNPVRIIQRFGRIDRIGSRNDTIHLINFWPTQDLDNYIQLKNRVEARMALVDLTATAEENILNNEEIKDLIEKDMKYRDKQLLRLKDEVLDLEDFNDTVSLGDFSLDDFRMELLRFLDKNKERLEHAPLGLYAVVPTGTEYESLKPGVIFCLRQKGGFAENEKVNPVHPHYLVYIQNSGDVRLSFVQTRQILEIYRVLCSGKERAYAELCALFNTETEQGRNMSAYDNLLKKAVAAIAATFKIRTAAHLQSGRNAVLPGLHKQPEHEHDFELITWLVIK